MSPWDGWALFINWQSAWMYSVHEWALGTNLPWAEMGPCYGWALSQWILRIDGPWAGMNLMSYRNVWALGRDGPSVSDPGDGWLPMDPRNELALSRYGLSACMSPGQG